MSTEGTKDGVEKLLADIDAMTDILDVPEDTAPRLMPRHSYTLVQIRRKIRDAKELLKNYNEDGFLKDVITLIRAHYGNDEDWFRKASREVAEELSKQGRTQLELFVKSELGETPTFVPM